MEEIQLVTLEDNKKYVILDEIEGSSKFIFLAEAKNENNFVVRKEVKEDNEVYLVGLDNKEEVDEALKLFQKKNAN